MPKVIIKGLPKKQVGGATGKTGDQQSNYGFNTGSIMYHDTDTKDGSQPDIRSTYPKVDREDANVEIELGEYLIQNDLGSIYKAGGKKHSQGGTPIQAKEGAYIVSDFIKTNQPISEALGFDYDPKNDKKQTWAKLLQSKIDTKEYNSFSSLMKDKQQGKLVDQYEFNTAKNKLPEYQSIVSKIALGNELSKAIEGKPYEIPQIAQPAMQSLQQPMTDEKDSNPLVEAKYGGGLPKYQTKGLINTYQQPIDADLQSKQSNGYDVTRPSMYQPNMPSIQHQTKQGVYGNEDWSDQNHMMDFSNRFPEFMKLHPDFDPTKTDHTKLFQNWYNQNINPNYFNGNGAYAIDGKWGQHTFSAPTWDKNKQSIPNTIPGTPPPNIPTPPPTKTPPPNTIPSKDPIDFGNKKPNQNLGYDVGNIMGMLNSMKTDATRYPWSAKQDINLANPVFDNTNYYPIQAAQRSRMDSMNQISNPNMARSVGSYQPDQISGILQETQRVNGNNLQIANSAQANNAQIMNQAGANEAQRQTNLYDNTVKTLDNRFVQNKLAANDFQFGNARNNKAQMAYLLTKNFQMGISNPNDYSSLVGFNGNGKGIGDQGTQQQDEFANLYGKFKQYSGREPDASELMDLLKIHHGSGDYTKNVKKPGQQGYTTTTMDRT